MPWTVALGCPARGYIGTLAFFNLVFYPNVLRCFSFGLPSHYWSN